MGDNPCSHPSVQMCGAAGSRGYSFPLYNHRAGEVSNKQEVQAFPSDCVCPPEGAIKVPSLILGCLDRALCNLADLGRSLMELQKALQVSLKAFRTSFLYLCRAPLYRVFRDLWTLLQEAIS